MAGAISFKFKGGVELERALKDLGNQKQMVSAARHALRKGADEIIPTAKALVPEREGDLKRSIKQGAAKQGKNADKDTVKQIIGIDQWEGPPTFRVKADGTEKYRDPGVAGVGPMQEFGTDNMPANPFMRPAFDMRKGRAIVTIRKELGAAIERRAKSNAKRAK